MSRRDALNDDQRDEIWRLHVKRVSQREIADRIGCNRNTVSAVVRRTTEQLAEGRRTEMEVARNEALAVYDEIQREIWKRLEQCPATSSLAVGYLSVIVEARRRQDRLLGLEKLTVNHTQVYLTRIDALMNQPIPLPLIEEISDD